jgi:cobalt/nickel transport system ATP-binding protein
MTALLSFTNVRFAYHGAHPVLEDASLVLQSGEKIGLVGDMGSGKTTFLHLAVGLLKPQAGEVAAFGVVRRAEHDFREVRRRIGLVFQHSDDQLFCPTVLEDVAFGPLNLGLSVEAARQAAASALAQVGLRGFEHRVTYRLSGGEKRLVALATVLAMHPEVLLLDEPQNGLDRAAYLRVRDLLVELPQSMIVVSHDRDFLEAVTTRRLYLHNGRIQSTPP